ncbi:N-myristoyl transferase [Thozetella sp. PMI_491]|nr:N-myristoyl transferase [Thozetella sp. PMI_491]
MSFYKFWKTQPVPQFNDLDMEWAPEGSIIEIDPSLVSGQPLPLAKGLEWATIDLDDNVQIQDLSDLLEGHYVEDKDNMFRFNSSTAYLRWSLNLPGWRSDWQLGVRDSETSNLVASILATPIDVQIRKTTLHAVLVNFLCIHSDYRYRRLVPVLVNELRRRCSLEGISQAVYTSGGVLPTPISTARYYHRSLNVRKLHETGFQSVPYGSTTDEEEIKYALPEEPAIQNLRPMVNSDVSRVCQLLKRYVAGYDVAPVFTEDLVRQCLIDQTQPGEEPVITTYVVEDKEAQDITDIVSFSRMDQQVLQPGKHPNIRECYLYYYASSSAFGGEQTLQERLISLVKDALIMAKKARCDVFTALTICDNPLFLRELQFNAGDGFLHYYLFNYRTAPVPGGLLSSLSDSRSARGIGILPT